MINAMKKYEVKIEFYEQHAYKENELLETSSVLVDVSFDGEPKTYDEEMELLVAITGIEQEDIEHLITSDRVNHVKMFAGEKVITSVYPLDSDEECECDEC